MCSTSQKRKPVLYLAVVNFVSRFFSLASWCRDIRSKESERTKWLLLKVEAISSAAAVHFMPTVARLLNLSISSFVYSHRQQYVECWKARAQRESSFVADGAVMTKARAANRISQEYHQGSEEWGALQRRLGWSRRNFQKRRLKTRGVVAN